MELIEAMTPWHWLALAGALFIMEVLMPAAFFLWIGIAATVTGLILLLVDISAEARLLIFSTLSIVSIVLSRLYLKRHPSKAGSFALSRRGEQYIGRTFTLVKPIENGVGKAQVEDSLWRVVGEDMPEGTRVTVTGIRGSSLVVENAG